jgi:hypothetical protein
MANTPKPVRQSMKADDSLTRATIKTNKARKAYDSNPSQKTAETLVGSGKKAVSAAKKNVVKTNAEGRSSVKAMNKAAKTGGPSKITKVSLTALKGAKNTIKNRAEINKARGD